MLAWILELDTSLFLWLHSLPHPTWLTPIMHGASAVGAAAAVWFLLAGLLAITCDPAAGFRAAAALVVTGCLVGGILKPLIGRQRPAVAIDTVEILAPRAPESKSFPSGHAASATAGAYAVTRRWPYRWFWILAVLITFSRLYLGVHYPLDLLAGIGVGLACAGLVTGGSNRRVKPATPTASPA